MTTAKRNKILKEAFSTALYFLAVFALTAFVLKYVGQRSVVDGNSMNNTLYDGESLWVNKFIYRFREPERFDIVVFPFKYQEDTFFIKRIIGLPGETPGMMLDQCSIISGMPLTSIKFHQLQIVKGTRMEKEYAASPEDFLRLGLEDYLDLVIDILERLRPDLCIERVAGEVPPRFVSETPWGLIRNDGILKLLDRRLEERNTYQGIKYTNP